ncbi:MAG: hypothetical protein ACE145_05105 [Terriglobia bacterium]
MGLSKCVPTILAAALFLPAGLLAADHTCAPAAPTPESYTHDFVQEANKLLTQVRDQANDVKREADGLATLSRFNEIDWRDNSERINEIRDHVNAMGRDLCRLDQIRGAVSPWQQQEIDRIMPTLVELADSTESAIKVVNAHQTTFWATDYPNEAANIYNEASRIDNTVSLKPEYAKGPANSTASTPSGM